MFLELVREVSERDPDLARAALAGLRAYEEAPHRDRPAPRPEIARVAGATLRDHGGSGPPALLVPSLINPPRILDLDEQVSLTGAIARMGRRALLLDWGKADERAELSVSGHVEQLLLPLLRQAGEPVALIGYCLGGTMAIAAANRIAVDRLATIAAPWHFAAYPDDSKQALADMWRHSEAAAKQLGALPMEVLQAAFWSLDPKRTVRKFADFGRIDPASAAARRFVELEEWANEGEPLPYPAAKELIEGLFGEDLPGAGQWIGSDKVPMPALHLTADHDRIVPAETAPAGEQIAIPSGHVGMIVGSARERLNQALAVFLHEQERTLRREQSAGE
ncbi:MAG TPA: alpha/beta hydrolase [Sphingomicrobium sp.]|nr:alpha/beta hydrolase [Sphingomicrobium sp.]